MFDADQTVRAYKDLSKVERAFRSMKTVDLKVRPIYHRRADRVRAHVLLCMLAYYVEWHMRSELAPVLFDDHDPEAWPVCGQYGCRQVAALATGVLSCAGVGTCSGSVFPPVVFPPDVFPPIRGGPH